MASTDAKPVPQKNVAYRVTFPILDADGDLVTGATGLDSEISKDGGTFADCTNEATEIATNSGMYFLDLTSTEMNADTVAIIVKTSSSGAKTTPIVMYPEEAGDIRVNVTQFGSTNGTFASGRPEVNTTHAAGTAWASGAITAAVIATGAIDADAIADNAIDAGAIAANAITSGKIADGAITAAKVATGAIDADALAADAITAIQSGLATAAALATVDQNVDDILVDTSTTLPATLTTILGHIDTEVAAILEDTGTTLPAQIAALNNLSAAEVNAEVVDVLTVDTFAEPGQGAPAATASLAAKIGYLFKAWRNKITQSSSEYKVFADDGVTVDQKATVSDDGTTFTRAEVGTGA
jgi:hypothetical protein